MVSPIIIALCFATILIDRGHCVHPEELNLIFFGVRNTSELAGWQDQDRLTAITNKLCPPGEVQNLVTRAEHNLLSKNIPFEHIKDLVARKVPIPFVPTVKVEVDGSSGHSERIMQTKVEYFQLVSASAVEAGSIEMAKNAGIECLRAQNGEFILEYFSTEKMNKVKALVFHTFQHPAYEGIYFSLIHAELTSEGQDESQDFWVE